MKTRTVLIVSFLLIMSTIAFAESPDKYQLTPTENTNFPEGIYIPKDLNDAFHELDSMLHSELISEIKDGPEDDMILHHMGLGMWMRNYWGLWRGSRLQSYFAELGIQHPDDMSGILLDSYWRQLNNKSVDLDGQIKHYKEYWEAEAGQQH